MPRNPGLLGRRIHSVQYWTIPPLATEISTSPGAAYHDAPFGVSLWTDDGARCFSWRIDDVAERLTFDPPWTANPNQRSYSVAVADDAWLAAGLLGEGVTDLELWGYPADGVGDYLAEVVLRVADRTVCVALASPQDADRVKPAGDNLCVIFNDEVLARLRDDCGQNLRKLA